MKPTDAEAEAARDALAEALDAEVEAARDAWAEAIAEGKDPAQTIGIVQIGEEGVSVVGTVNGPCLSGYEAGVHSNIRLPVPLARG